MSDNVSSGKLLAAVGVAVAAAVTGVGLFLFLKPDDDEELLSRHSRHVAALRQQQQQAGTSFSLTDRLRIPAHVVGDVIGRGGESVRRLQVTTKTKIDIDDVRDGSGDRWATIAGSREGIEEAKEAIEAVIQRKGASVFTEEVNVPYHLIGSLIGRDGCTIRAMCASSGAKINVPRSTHQPISGFVAVSVKGSLDQVNEARRQINQIINDSRSKRGFADASPPLEDHLFKEEDMLMPKVANGHEPVAATSAALD